MRLSLKNFIFGFIFLAITALMLGSASADYIATDKFWGMECKYYIACKRVYLHAHDSGEGLHAIRTTYPENTVDEFNKEMGVCHIKIDKGLFGGLFKIFTTKGFYTKLGDGTHRPVSIDTLSFNCSKIE